MKIKINILTESEIIKNICNKYWHLADERHFLYSLTEIMKEFDLSQDQILKIVQANCTAFSLLDKHRCISCGKSKLLLKNRSHYHRQRQKRYHYKLNDHFDSCGSYLYSDYDSEYLTPEIVRKLKKEYGILESIPYTFECKDCIEKEKKRLRDLEPVF